MFSEHLSNDERIVRYFGRHGCELYMKGRLVKFGYNLRILSSFDVYPSRIIPYQAVKQLGKQMWHDYEKKEKKSLAQSVVENWLSFVETLANHKIYKDNIFKLCDLSGLSEASVSLLREQLRKIE
ncbi:hypothetical protein AVEN_246220-1 [Araneus ventricosus]|uniref:PiggyBac transposable element-derived protein domain-containing protein n=1 Tax=Araneus ventricosus TaxID=182803 RepID=A0A4Y2Q6M7_ARAVE|nr:hypothetical protein AVEN_246220-1 [Araneus ventricosus]